MNAALQMQTLIFKLPQLRRESKQEIFPGGTMTVSSLEEIGKVLFTSRSVHRTTFLEVSILLGKASEKPCCLEQENG